MRPWSAGCCIVSAAAVLAASAADPQARASDDPSPVVFRETAGAAGLDFVHENGASDEKYFVEIVGSGGAFLDYDADGWIDIFLVDGGSLADETAAGRARHRLYRNRGDGTFADVTDGSGIAHREYGMGACAADYDNDGWTDLYITNFGPNVLYRNNGDGTFTDVSREAAVEAPLWSTSCAFTDIDRDGHLDLFVVDYVAASLTENPFCGATHPPIRIYCHPLHYAPLPSVLYRSTGDGRFEDVSAGSGIGAHRSNGFGVSVADFDDDGWPDIFVANDALPDLLHRNMGDGTFEEIGLLAGVAVPADGKSRAGMGTAAGDVTGDGRPDLVVTNHEREMHSLFKNLGGGLFEDATVSSGIGAATLPYVGFGVAFVDYDNDGRLDLSIANGHVIDNIALFRKGASHAQPNLLLRNTGAGSFRDAGRQAGPGFGLKGVSRLLATADIDNDGDLDLLVTNNGGAAHLLVNDGGNRQNSLLVRTVGAVAPAAPDGTTASNRDGIGARLTLTAGGVTQMREVRSGSSFLGQNDLRVHFGLGSVTHIERLEVRWPSGRTDVVRGPPVNHAITVVEGEGITARTALAARQ